MRGRAGTAPAGGPRLGDATLQFLDACVAFTTAWTGKRSHTSFELLHGGLDILCLTPGLRLCEARISLGRGLTHGQVRASRQMFHALLWGQFQVVVHRHLV